MIIRPAKTIEDCQIAADTTLETWQDPGLVVSTALLLTIIKNKGVVLLAYDGDKPIGYCFSFVGYEGDPTSDMPRLKHCSHHAAMIPAYQGKGLGEQLKWEQRDAILAQGIVHITWTFDPLEAMNANLNFRKLGAVCSTYIPNCYGDMQDALNKGIPSDRFQVDWWLDSDWVESHAEGEHTQSSAAEWLESGATLLNQTEMVDGFLTSHKEDAGSWSERALLVIPKNYQQMKRDDHDLAAHWRQQTRTIFQEAFQQGYTAIDLLMEADGCVYLFQRGWSA